MASEEQIKFVNGLWQEYLNSTIPLKEYDHQFEVPEVWLPQETPVDLIRIVHPRPYK